MLKTLLLLTCFILKNICPGRRCGPVEVSRYSDLLQACVPTSPGANPAYCTKGIGTLPGGKTAWALITHLHLASWLKKVQSYTSTPSEPSWPVLG